MRSMRTTEKKTYNAEGCGKYDIGMYMSSKNPTDTYRTVTTTEYSRPLKTYIVSRPRPKTLLLPESLLMQMV